MSAHSASNKHISHAREKFLERTRKVTPGTSANQLYINTSDPAYYEKILRCNRHHVPALYQMGRKCEKQGYLHRAEEYYEKAIAVQPTFEPAVGALVLLRRRQKEEERMLQQMALSLSPPKKKVSSIQVMGVVLIMYLFMLLLLFGIILR
ncbi:tetratricopeptide repeat protein [Aneurinibacillus tyrosinisolvens]|uniref:tetratricopeptide repeat protein n=1 Tax=Aneurinibacillus tyrosinisolvens TaxID=1443435 RepID=UPI00063F4AC4|nr:tetratricopeptide repeat protein [Aneurinibacillus tyrosinisolvens]